MDIVIVAQYLRNIEDFEGNNSRFIYIAKELIKEGIDSVEIITSDFSHGKKQHFKSVGELKRIKITTCHESGYPKNVCLKRFGSHKELAKNIRLYLNERITPDLVYTAVPSLDVADVCASYCKRNNVKFVIDIQDLWPEAFRVVFNIPIISNIIFAPMKKQADRIYKAADRIVAVSKTYADRGKRVNMVCPKPEVIFLGTELETFDLYKGFVRKNRKDEILFAYCGTLGHSYDLTSTFDALSILQEKGIKYRFVIMGDGPLKNRFVEYARKKGINAEFTGTLNYPDMVRRLCECDIALNPIMHGAAQSIINKHADYVAAGLPIISTQESKEFRQLIDDYSMGFNCRNGEPKDMAEKMERLIYDEKLRLEMGKNARRCAQERFDRKYTYTKLAKIITSVV
ncbi:glycosyltransferase family 4 protein [Claveliimonas bilis]|uniref:Glycosyl transferase family 1 domain-containing protein n=1 Tax=Claveliimonas bilis TaxID=3028070 RepID=A0ABN6YZ39_9FIRM|nr:glycosyltransferase family 4 protein [Claveliimonas bilis]BDZ78153.1 hypothetical protein Lac1_23360 [Claveliimonas bilis]